MPSCADAIQILNLQETVERLEGELAAAKKRTQELENALVPFSVLGEAVHPSNVRSQELVRVDCPTYSLGLCANVWLFDAKGYVTDKVNRYLTDDDFINAYEVLERREKP